MLLPNYNPIQVQRYRLLDELHHIIDPAQCVLLPRKPVWVRVETTDGGIYDAKRVPLELALPRGWPDDKPQLYVTRAGNFFSVSSRGCAQVKPFPCSQTEEYRKTGGCWRYLFMKDFGNITCHKAVYWAYKGDPGKGKQIDHGNGDPTDNHIDNLEAVTPAENRRRAKILRRLRKTAGIHPLTYGYYKHLFELSEEELEQFFNKYNIN